MTDKPPVSQTTPLILRLLREERDRIERMMDQVSKTISWPGYERRPWFDDAAHLAAERLKLAECNAVIAGRLAGRKIVSRGAAAPSATSTPRSPA